MVKSMKTMMPVPSSMPAALSFVTVQVLQLFILSFLQYSPPYIDSEKKREQTNFEDIFFPEHKEHIPDFIKKLEDRKIIKDGKRILY